MWETALLVDAFRNTRSLCYNAHAYRIDTPPLRGALVV